ncbi:hypothetical protein SLA2020_479270 [Shorea laevis]
MTFKQGDFSTKAWYLAERWNGSLNVLGISGMFCLSLVPYGVIKCVGEKIIEYVIVMVFNLSDAQSLGYGFVDGMGVVLELGGNTAVLAPAIRTSK